MKKELFNGKRLKVARIYRGKTIDQVSKETNINKKDMNIIISFLLAYSSKYTCNNTNDFNRISF